MANARWLAVIGFLMLCQACSLSDHRVAQSSLGRPSSLADMEKLIDIPGPIEVETINSADWTVPLAGLLNLKSPAAQAAHLTDHPEPITYSRTLYATRSTAPIWLTPVFHNSCSMTPAAKACPGWCAKSCH
jgi:hypothetical protein